MKRLASSLEESSVAASFLYLIGTGGRQSDDFCRDQCKAKLGLAFDGKAATIPQHERSAQMKATVTGSGSIVTSLGHPRQSPTPFATLPHFPVFSSPTATLEVVGKTGNWSSEKAGGGGSAPSLATTSSLFTCAYRL